VGSRWFRVQANEIAAQVMKNNLHSGRKFDGLGLSGNLNLRQSIVVNDKCCFDNLAAEIFQGAWNFSHNLVALFKLGLAPVGNDLVFAGCELGLSDCGGCGELQVGGNGVARVVFGRDRNAHCGERHDC
jgi:hypothetical protein